MQDSKKLISTVIDRYIPQFIRMEYPVFVDFITIYLQWLEQNGKPYHFIANALNFSDIDRTSLELLEIFGRNFLSSLPDIIYDQNNIATLVKNINQYYSAIGSEKAFEFLFRLFDLKDDDNPDNEYIEMYYPSYDILRVSDGKWVNERSIKIKNPPENVTDWVGAEINGVTSLAKGIVDEIKLYTTSDSNTEIAELFLIDFDIIHGINKFRQGETINVITKELETYTIQPEKVLGKIKITSGGKYFSYNQRVRIINKNLPGLDIGEDARVVVDQVYDGEVTGFDIIHPGQNYQVNDKITVTGTGFGNGAYGYVKEVDANGGITKTKLVYGGGGYGHNQKVVIDSKNGTGAVLFIESDDIGTVKSLEIRNFGYNYDPDNVDLVFNTVMRIYDIDIDGEIGETYTGQTSGATGVVEYWDRVSNTISVYVTSGTFVAGETIIGDRWGGSATIYDIYTATAEITEDCICRYKGRYLNMDGHISSLRYIQDSYFYQVFSYLIKTNKDKQYWKDTIAATHPAGMIGFSYNDILLQYKRESDGGFIGPKMESTEFYKFRWQPNQFHGGFVSNFSNTQIKQYANIIIDEISNINTNILDKTNYCFGSNIKITTN